MREGIMLKCLLQNSLSKAVFCPSTDRIWNNRTVWHHASAITANDRLRDGGGGGTFPRRDIMKYIVTI